MRGLFPIKRLVSGVWVLGGQFGTARASLNLYSRWVNSIFFACLLALPRPLRAPLPWRHADDPGCQAPRAAPALEVSSERRRKARKKIAP
jgi:hypothetical protein